VENVLFSDEILPYDRFEDDVYLPSLSKKLDDNNYLLISHAIPQVRVTAFYEAADYLVEFAVMAIPLSLLIGITLAYVILRRINTINDTATKIMKGNIGKRIPLSNKNDEFDGLSIQSCK